eukprot:6070616-Amphidinium_carterae.1
MLDCLPDQEGLVMSGTEDNRNAPHVRVDEIMDGRVAAGADDPEVIGAEYKVGPHACRLTDGDTRMTCKKCGRYVTTYKGTWRNLGTIAKQPCKPKARRQKGRAGKAAHKQSGGAQPALPPGSPSPEEEPLAPTRSQRSKNPRRW